MECPAFFKYLADAQDSNYVKICKPLTTTLSKCVASVVPVLIVSLKEHSSGCCDAFLEDFKRGTGQTPSKFLPEIVDLDVDTICATHSPGFDEQKQQTCGFSLIQAFVSKDKTQKEVALNLVQIPNNQGCNARTGKEFNTTTNELVKFNTNGKTVDSCAKPIDSLSSKFA